MCQHPRDGGGRWDQISKWKLFLPSSTTAFLQPIHEKKSLLNFWEQNVGEPPKKNGIK